MRSEKVADHMAHHMLLRTNGGGEVAEVRPDSWWSGYNSEAWRVSDDSTAARYGSAQILSITTV